MLVYTSSDCASKTLLKVTNKALHHATIRNVLEESEHAIDERERGKRSGGGRGKEARKGARKRMHKREEGGKEGGREGVGSG